MVFVKQSIIAIIPNLGIIGQYIFLASLTSLFHLEGDAEL
jgi:hypothetical protein